MAPTQPQPITISTPISLTSTTPSLPPATTQALIAHLRGTNSIPELSSLLSDSLARTGWTDRVRALSLELLRNGSCDTFPELLTEVTRRAKIPKTTSNGQTTSGGTGRGERGGKTTTNGTGVSTPASATNGAGTNGSGAIAVSKEWSGGPDGLPDVRIPEVTVDVGVEFLREKIKDVVEPVEHSDSD